MAQVQTECVLVVPTDVFRGLGYFQGFSGTVDHYLDELLDARHTSYRPRYEMEQDPEFKQLIPYVIFRYSDPEGQTYVFQYTRGKGQGEGRLHSKKSIGIGGHISADDVLPTLELAPARAAYEEGMRRELAEEVEIETTYTERCVGLINDDQTEVGKVHLGIVHVFDVERPAVQPLENDIIEAGFRPLDEILGNLDQFETWSQICVRALFSNQKSSR